MPDSIVLGVGGLRLSPCDHVCAFYRGPAERDEILIPYLRAGLVAGDKVICVVDALEPSQVVAALTAGSDRSCVADGQLDVLASPQAYLRQGRFSTEEMLRFWDEAVASALGAGRFPFARAVGEMTWALTGLPGVGELVGYESELNRFLPRYPQVILCLYDLDRFDGDVLVDILKTHPKILLGGMVLENPYYLEPDEFLASRA